MLKYPLMSIARHRMLTDGVGVTTLVTSYLCPLKCKYCINRMCMELPEKVEYLNIDELYEKVKIDDLYFVSTGGGLTFGGGEPLLYSEFIKEFITKYKHTGWTFNLETSLSVPREKLEDVIGLVDCYIIDCKSMNEETYEKYTGKSMNEFSDNLKYLLSVENAEKIRVRVPLIPGFNDTEEQYLSKEILKSMGVSNIELFDYVIRK